MKGSQQVSDVLVETNTVSASQYEEVADKDDLMGVEDTAKKGILPARPAAGGDVDGNVDCEGGDGDVDSESGGGDDVGGDVDG